ncbi:Haloacid dehalogenase-like hydrolase, partial [Pseudoloma neurophilia]
MSKPISDENIGQSSEQLTINETINVKNDFNGPLYIPLNPDNIQKYKSLIKPVKNEPLLVFDIDSTLYSSQNGLEFGLKESFIELFTELFNKNGKKHNFTKSDIAKVVSSLRDIYGITFRGAIKELSVDASYFKNLLKNFPFEKYIKKDDKLKESLDQMKIRKICFTNAGIDHAERVLKAIGIENCFQVIITTDVDNLINENFDESQIIIDELIEKTKEFLKKNKSGQSNVNFDPHDKKDFICKPLDEAYKFIEELFEIDTFDENISKFANISALKGGENTDDSVNQITQKNILFFDDALRNINTANKFGWQTVHVRNDKHIVELINESVNEKL